jgi:hypothetical protein
VSGKLTQQIDHRLHEQFVEFFPTGTHGVHWEEFFYTFAVGCHEPNKAKKL